MPRNNYGNLSQKSKQTSLRKNNNFTVNRGHNYKKQGWSPTSRYSSGHLIPIIQSSQDELRIKFPLEYLQV